MTRYIRPGFMITHVANPVLRRIPRASALIVRGRRTGKVLTVPMGEPLRLEGRRYLVSGRGETQWVRNLRAAGRCEFRTQGRATPFRSIEVFGVEHDLAISAYRNRLGHRVDGYFKQLPALRDHPVFRIEPSPDDGPASHVGGMSLR